MEIEYKNDDKVAFEFLLHNAAFIDDGDLYIKTHRFTEANNGVCEPRNCIRLKDLEFSWFGNSAMVKPVKAKVVVEED